MPTGRLFLPAEARVDHQRGSVFDKRVGFHRTRAILGYVSYHMSDKNLALLLGTIAGLVGLIAMVRLVSGAFTGGLSMFAWVVTLLAMVPWVGYVAARARHGNLDRRSGLIVAVLSAVGLAVVWFFVLGAVIALACSLAAFAVIWVKDWPPRRPAGEDRFVRIEELAVDDRD